MVNLRNPFRSASTIAVRLLTTERASELNLVKNILTPVLTRVDSTKSENETPALHPPLDAHIETLVLYAMHSWLALLPFCVLVCPAHEYVFKSLVDSDL